MFQVRIHGRGGQGVVSGAELLSVAAFLEGRYAQAFPSFGSERMGAPVMAFCRIDDREIRLREPVLEPDALIIQDATLLHQVDLFTGLRPDGYILLNSTRSFDELGLSEFASAVPALAAVHGARDRDRASSTSAAPCRTCRCSAASRRSPARCASSRWSPRSARSFRTPSPRRTSPRRPKPTAIVMQSRETAHA